MARLIRRSMAAMAPAMLLLAACGGDDTAETVNAADTAESTTSSSTERSTSTEAVDETDSSTVAEATGEEIHVYDGPTADIPTRTLQRADEISGKLIFLVAGETGERYEVFLPVRPNGSTGWIDKSSVTVTTHDFRVEVRLAEHRLEVLKGGETVLDTVIGVGTQDTPTPGGVFYVKDLLQPPTPDGPYGAFAYGLSGFSNELETFAGGDGVIGIHGTNRPDLLGQDVSHGCIRVHDDDMVNLVMFIGLPLGTPVAILP